MERERVLERIEEDFHRYLQELTEFLSFPSVSTYSHETRTVQRTAEWLAAHLVRLGLRAEVLPTDRHPVVYGRLVRAPELPTLLIYGHYDVQPPEPLEEWQTPPFTPTVRDGFLYARGATDDKGQLFTYLKAIEATLAETGELPINIKLLVEGEEEIGSPSLEGFLKANREALSADAVAVSDGSQVAGGVPAITYGLRGLSYLQLDVLGPRYDLHSGAFGGLVANPAQSLAEILARLKDRNGRVLIPGFYDDVQEPSPLEREEMTSLPFDEEALKQYLGIDTLHTEPGFHPMECKTARPTLDVNGIWGGFAGEGSKTIIPARAGAKVSMRLVPNQKSSRINQLFMDYVRTLTPPGVTLEVTDLVSCDPVLVSRDQPAVLAASRAIRTGFGKTPVFVREGGSIPIVNLFREILGIPNILLLGWGRPDDGAHSPNERFALEDFRRGTRSAAALFWELREIGRGGKNHQ